MVFSFFKGGGDTGFEHIVSRSAAMLSDARHSFDLATLALLTDAGPGAVAADIRETDERINHAEQQLRSDLIVHVAVKGSADIGSVLGFTLLLKKIERIGDQAKNILELAEHGASLAGRADSDELLAERQVVSALFVEAAELLSDVAASEEDTADYERRCQALMDHHAQVVNQCLVSDRPGREVVPLAIYFRYLRRIVANLVGVVRVSGEPVPYMDYREGGTVDTDD